ncbi:hypothetical protein PENTCL1PPCAC_26403, partial [Pristionchus entomophagus]
PKFAGSFHLYSEEGRVPYLQARPTGRLLSFTVIEFAKNDSHVDVSFITNNNVLKLRDIQIGVNVVRNLNGVPYN